VSFSLNNQQTNRTKGNIMRKQINVLILGCIGLMGGFGQGVSSGRGDLEVSASLQIHARTDFEAPLAPQGTWVDVGSYGRCWRPAHVAVGWRPYVEGRWVWTDCGWYWESDEPWGWACYHYGTWVQDPALGWVWVPGVEWAPAWVSWRVADGYIGWAPLPPPGVLIAHRPPPPAFVFVTTARFADPIRPTMLVKDTAAIVGKTTEINEVRRETRTLPGGAAQQVVINRGPGVEVVQKAVGKPIAPVPFQDVARRNPPPTSMKPSLAGQPQGEPGKDRFAPAPGRPGGPGEGHVRPQEPERKDRDRGENHGPGKP
jgi:hypothetical protein